MAVYFPPRTAVVSCILTRVIYTDSTVGLNVVISGRAVPENSRSSYSRRVFELGRIVSLVTARPPEYPSSLN